MRIGTDGQDLSAEFLIHLEDSLTGGGVFQVVADIGGVDFESFAISDDDPAVLDIRDEIDEELPEEIGDFVGQKLAPIEGVTSTVTCFMLKKYKVEGMMLEEEPLKDERQIVHE